jgi:hypothetical protein
MGISLLITRIHAIVIVLVILACVMMGTLGFMSWGTPKLKSALEQVVAHYDAYLPEITLERGRATIKKEQPYFVDIGQGRDTTIVIDTREGHAANGLNYLKEAREGVVLTRDSLIVKNQGETRILPLQNFPDVVISSEGLQALMDQYLDTALKLTAVFVAVYFLLAKPFQIFMLALIPFIWARFASVPATYGQSVKIAAICMIPPVLFSTVMDFTSFEVRAKALVYFAMYIGLLVVVSLDLMRSARRSVPFSGTSIPSA